MTQTVDVQGGDHNTVVQIDGNGNTVVLGQPHLRLTRFEAERNKPQTDARLLIPARRAIPLFGRDEELKWLLDFVRPDAPPDIRVRVLVGSGGSGKTRLALELCDQIKGRWLAGFATTQALERFFKQQDAGAWGWQKSTLIVLDYAAAQSEVLQRWLPELQERAVQPQHPLRILLLERHADPESGWHQRVFNPGGWQSAGTRDLLDPPEPVPIHPLYEVDDRLGVVRAVLTLVKPDLLSLLTPELLDAAFQQTPWGGDPLYLAMAALTMAQRGDASALRLGRTDLALEVAGHEMNRLAQAAKSRGLEPDLVQHLAACITLLQGLPRTETLRLIRTEKQAIGFEQGDPAKLVDVLHDCLTDGEHIAAVQPDLIGEALLLRAWVKPERAAAIARLFADHAPRVTETLIRLAQDFSEVDSNPKAWLQQLIRDHWHDSPALARISEAMPSVTVALSDINLQLAQRSLEIDVDASPEVKARQLGVLALALMREGQHESALTAAKQAADMYDELVRLTPEDHFRDWTTALNNLAIVLSALGDLQAGLSVAQRVEYLNRQLARQSPNLYMSGWATSLSNLANRLSELGRHEEALERAQHATDLRQTLALQCPDIFTSEWATSLSNLANLLGAVGRFDLALDAAKQAVDLHRKLSLKNPDAHLPGLAASLNNLSNMQSCVGSHDAARAAAQEGVDVYRALAHRRPDIYSSELATSISNLSATLSVLGQSDLALDLAQQAVDLRCALAKRRPNAHTKDWAASLSNLAGFLSNLGRHEEALEAAQLSAELRRSLASQRPDVFTPDWATSLNNLSVCLSNVGLHEHALEAAEQAVELRRELAKQRPDVFDSDLASSLNNFSNTLAAMGWRQEALEAAEQAVSLYASLARRYPELHTPDWAMSLGSLANRLRVSGQHEAALDAAKQAENLYQDLTRQRPDAHTADWAMSLSNLANLLSAVGKYEKALLVAQHAVELRRELARLRPEAFTQDLATSLLVFAVSQSHCGLHGEAARQAQQAVQVLSPVFLKRPQILGGQMSSMLREYIRLCQAAQVDLDMALLTPLLPYFQRPSEENSDD